MRVLLTNVALELRAGSELYLLDVSRWLQANGHSPVVYSAHLGPLADEFRTGAIPVTDDARTLTEPPDVIHAQHHLPTMAALSIFPHTPAAYFCHGWLPWAEAPPRHPAIRRYVAVSEATRERLIAEGGVAPERVQILPNFVDTERFVPGPALPERPRRALLFSNLATDGGWVSELRAACRDRGIELDLAGSRSGKTLEAPQHALPGYDLVFARGRSALEAMAVGDAVILCDVEGLGEMVTPDNLTRLRRGNFGVQVLRDPHRRDLFLRQIDRYSAATARRVAELVRAEHALERVLPSILGVYRDVVEEARDAPHTLADVRAAEAGYMRWLNRNFPHPWLKRRESIERQAESAHDRGRRSAAQLEDERARWKREREALLHSHRQLQASAEATLRRKQARIDSLLTQANGDQDGKSEPDDVAPGRADGSGLSCVVLDVGEQPSLVEAVRSLVNQEPQPEIAVVSSGGGHADRLLREAGFDVTVIQCPQRLMPGAARNVGVAATQEPFVAFLAGDCIAEPGWVAGRLAAHREGADLVSSAVTNANPWNPWAAAAHCLLFSRRLPQTPPAERLDFGVSYARSIFERHGRFRDELRSGEDTELNERLSEHTRFVYRGDVRSAHRNPTTLLGLLRDQFARGRRMAGSHAALARSSRKAVARGALTRVPGLVRLSWNATPKRHRPRIIWSLPWLWPGALAYALGAATARNRAGAASARPATPARRKLVCVTVFRNERRHLDGFLANVSPHFDGVLALDDGSTDGSGDLFVQHPDVLEYLRIAPRDPHVWDEVRNQRILVDAAHRHGAEWVMAIDADERVERDFRRRAERELARAVREGHLAYSLAKRELWDRPDRYRADGIWGRKRIDRLFKLRLDHDFGSMALHGPWAPDNSKDASGSYPHADLILYHLRMVDRADRERRRARYERLDPDRRWQQIGYEYLTDESGLKLEALPPGREYLPLPPTADVPRRRADQRLPAAGRAGA